MKSWFMRRISKRASIQAFYAILLFALILRKAWHTRKDVPSLTSNSRCIRVSNYLKLFVIRTVDKSTFIVFDNSFFSLLPHDTLHSSNATAIRVLINIRFCVSS
jgi:hypothetical protein